MFRILRYFLKLLLSLSLSQPSFLLFYFFFGFLFCFLYLYIPISISVSQFFFFDSINIRKCLKMKVRKRKRVKMRELEEKFSSHKQNHDKSVKLSKISNTFILFISLFLYFSGLFSLSITYSLSTTTRIGKILQIILSLFYFVGVLTIFKPK